MRKLFLTMFVLIISSSILFSQESKPKSADEILKVAYKESKGTNKNVFLIFHASWCSWCKRLEKAMNSDELKNIFTDNFVITHLDVLERGDKIETLENPGGKEIMKELGGEKSGLPFYAFLDSEGKKIANSNVMEKESNIGYPGSQDEINAFTGLLKSAAPKMSEESVKKIVAYLTENAPKPRQ